MKTIKTIFTITAAFALALTSHAQFRGTTVATRDLLNGTPLTITTGAISNITVYGNPGVSGYTISPYLVLTNSGTPSIAFYQTPVVPNAGSGTTPTAAVPALVGSVAGSGTTAVRGNVGVWTNQNAFAIQISVSNTHSASIVLSNLYFISP